MNQAELQRLATERIADAKVLLDGNRWEFAFYTAGYAVECALKSCVLKRMVYTAWVFEEKWKAQDCLTHDFRELVRLAGLENELNAKAARAAANAPSGGPAGGLFNAFWSIVSSWNVSARYQSRTEPEAKALYEAITHQSEGVLPWLQNYW